MRGSEFGRSIVTLRSLSLRRLALTARFTTGYKSAMGIDAKLLEILLCPACQGSIREQLEPHGLRCEGCSLLYPVRDGIPVMLVEEAKKD